MAILTFFIFIPSAHPAGTGFLQGPFEHWDGAVQRMFAFLSLKSLVHLVRVLSFNSACVGMGSLLTLCKV